MGARVSRDSSIKHAGAMDALLKGTDLDPTLDLLVDRERPRRSTSVREHG